MKRIYSKLAVRSRGQAAFAAHQQGLLPHDLLVPGRGQVLVPVVVVACTLRHFATVWRVRLVHVLMVGWLIGPGMAMAAVTTLIDTAHTTSTVDGLTTVDPQGRLPYP